MTVIKKIEAREIKDSRGKQTLEVFVETEKSLASFAVPSGASRGMHEAVELRDPDGGIAMAVHNVNFIISPMLAGMASEKQKEIDDKLEEIDGTLNMGKLGANASIGVSLSCAKAAADEQGIPVWKHIEKLAGTNKSFPYLLMNLINGGKHAEGRPAFQEYLIIPEENNPRKAFDLGIKIHQKIEEIISDNGSKTIGRGDEGGFILNTESLERPLEIFEEALKKIKTKIKIKYGIDAAASSFWNKDNYVVGEEKQIKSKDLRKIYEDIIKKYKLIYLEDPFEEEKFDDFKDLQTKFKKLLVVGDDLTVTNPKRIRDAINDASISGVIIKPNQIGTLSKTIEAFKIASHSGVKCIVSHRSGETRDDFIADLAYGLGAWGLKAGAPLQTERRVKYERLIEIYDKERDK